MDSEAQARAALAAALDPLDRSAVLNVLRWASERYGLATPAPLTPKAPPAGGPALPEDEGSLY